MNSTPETSEVPTWAQTEAARKTAHSALLEIADESKDIGDFVGARAHDSVVDLRFASTMKAYPGWLWTATLQRVGDALPTVVEAGLLPGEGALLAPKWIPWSQRFAEYVADQQEGSSAQPRGAGSSDD